MSRESYNKKTFSRHLGAFTSATLISRILGYLRDSLVASFFGGGAATDAFYAAFKIPNLMRRFLGEGSLTAAFVPVFTDTLGKKGKEEANALLNSLLSGLVVVSVIVVIVGMIFAPQVTQVVSWGFTRDPEKFQLATQLTRLIFPFVIAVSLAAVLTAVLNASGVFFVPAVAPAGLSIAEIAFVVTIASHTDSAIQGLAVAAAVGGAIHFVWQIPSLYRAGYHLKWTVPFRHPAVKMVFVLMIPTILGLCADQVNSFVDQFCASFLRDGSVTALYNSNRVMQLPLALFGVAVSSISLPALSKSMSENNIPEFKDLLNFSLRISNFVLIPSFVGLAAAGLPIVQALFQHGRFTPQFSWMTYYAMVPYAAGLPAYSSSKILATAFYAQKDTKTPVRIALYSMAINAVLDFALMWRWEVAGLAFATATAAWFQAIMLFVILKRRMGPLGGRGLLKSFLYGSLAGLVMGGVCAAIAFGAMGNSPVILRVIVSVGTSAVLYLGLAKALKIPEYSFFMDSLLRRHASA